MLPCIYSERHLTLLELLEASFEALPFPCCFRLHPAWSIQCQIKGLTKEDRLLGTWFYYCEFCDGFAYEYFRLHLQSIYLTSKLTFNQNYPIIETEAIQLLFRTRNDQVYKHLHCASWLPCLKFFLSVPPLTVASSSLYQMILKQFRCQWEKKKFINDLPSHCNVYGEFVLQLHVPAALGSDWLIYPFLFSQEGAGCWDSGDNIQSVKICNKFLGYKIGSPILVKTCLPNHYIKFYMLLRTDWNGDDTSKSLANSDNSLIRINRSSLSFLTKLSSFWSKSTSLQSSILHTSKFEFNSWMV